MIRQFFIALLLLVPMMASAAEGNIPFHFDPNLGNEASMQRGAKLFMNYCSGCHSLEYMRYQRVSEDLGIPADVVENNLVMTGGKIGDTIKASMPAAHAADWFGKTPPDLSLESRARTPDWIYSFLLSFYLDDSRATGVNNIVMPNTAMPAVLAPLQGFQALNKESGDHAEDESEDEHAAPGFELVQKGQMSPAEYRRAAADITNFLVYVGEPAKLVRYSIGFKVLVFLLIFTGLAFMLKREFWRDVH